MEAPPSEAGQRRGAALPSRADLHPQKVAQHLRFALDTGHILLLGQRMLLLHGASLGEFRRELIETAGIEKAREMLTRLGYHQGVADAESALAVTDGDFAKAIELLPPLREIEGFVRNEPRGPLRFDFDSGDFFGDHDWTASWEAEAHLKQVGISGVPACWMMVGYASGCSTALMGRPVLWREQECVAMGSTRCRAIGRPLEEWQDAEDDLRFLRIEHFVSLPRRRPSSRRDPVRPVPATKGTSRASSFKELVGASAPFNAVVHRLRRVADTDATVLFLGESGVGKELFARTLHAIGPRAKQPFISVNCAAIPRDLVEAELFGVERGAFTGAIRSRAGRFERADGGTLFLDEVSSLPESAQGQLLRALQEGEIERLGDTKLRRVNVRIVAAANRDLRREVDAGRFRDDLFFRLNVFPIELPPLRERRDDIPLLADLFVERYSERFKKRIMGFTQRASQALWNYDWPGNVRELENLIERGIVLAEPDSPLDVHHLFTGGEKFSHSLLNLSRQGGLEPASDGAEEGGETNVDRLLEAVLDACPDFEGIEQKLLRCALERNQGNVSAAARLLKLRRGQVEYRLKGRSKTD